jgi:8-oxo-dGTP pyrophosphatase MutT (NUDIX family)
MILAGEGSDLSLCFIRRAERPGDRWSGHMAFPGGRASAGDPSAQAVAERETREEVGLALDGAQLVAPLSEMPIRQIGLERGMVLSSFVYHLGPEPAPLMPNGEVAAAYWVPLDHLWNPDNGTRLELERQGIRMNFPAVRYDGQVIWGLTFRVLTQFSDVLERPLPFGEEVHGPGL